MSKNFAFIFFSLVFFSCQVFAQMPRSTSFDDRPICEEAKGVWREFGNGCVDFCHPKFDQFSICTQALTYGCDCGKGRCWDGKTCVSQQSYKEIFDVEQAKEKKLLDEAKEKRKEAARANEEQIMTKLLKMTPDNSAGNSGDQKPQNPIQENSKNSAQASFQPQNKTDQQQPLESASQNQQSQKKIEIPPFFQKKQQAQNTTNQQSQTQTDSKPIEVQGNSLPKDTFVLPEIPLPN